MQANWFRITNETEVPSPSLLIFPERIEENLSRMIACVGDVDRLRPHVKTHKLPQVIALEIKHGISKFKVATIAEAEMTAQSGGRDILVAYPQVGPGPNRLTELVKKFPHVVFRAIADSDCGIDALSRAARMPKNSTDTLSLRLAFLPVACMHTTVTCTMPIMRDSLRLPRRLLCRCGTCGTV